MSSGKWQNGSIPAKPCGAWSAVSAVPQMSEAADLRNVRKEAAVKADVAKTYEYEVSLSSDVLVGRPSNEDNGSCRLAAHVTNHVSPAGHHLLASSSAAAETTAAAPRPGVACSGQDMLASRAPASPAAVAAAEAVGRCCPVAAAACRVGQQQRHDGLGTASEAGGCGDGRAALAELASRAAHGRRQPDSSGQCAVGCLPPGAADARCVGGAAAPVKDFVQFFESRHDTPESPKKFVPVAQPRAVTASAPGNCYPPNGDASHFSSKEGEALSSRALSPRSNPAPLDTQQSLVRLCCVASGYGRYAPKPVAMSRSSQLATDVGIGAAAAVPSNGETHQVSSGDTCLVTVPKVGAAVVRSEPCGENLQDEAASNPKADVERDSCTACQESVAPGESRCSDLEDGNAEAISNGQTATTCRALVQLDDSAKCNGTEDAAASTNSSKAGEEFLARVLNEEQRLNGLSQLSSNDVSTNLLPEEVCGRLRSAIGKANLLVCKKFKQFKELCNKNMTQAADERYKTTAEDLQGFWDMMMLQVEDVDRAFSEIAQLRANGWQCASVDVKGTDFAADSAREVFAKSSDSPATTTASTPRPKTTPVRRLVGSTPGESKNRKADAAAATPASKAREEARQRLLAAKKAMRRRSSNDDTAGAAGSADVVVFLGGGVTTS